MRGLSCSSGRRLARLLFGGALVAGVALAAGGCNQALEPTIRPPRAGETAIQYRRVAFPGSELNIADLDRTSKVLASRAGSLGATGWGIGSSGTNQLDVTLDGLKDAEAVRPWLRARGEVRLVPLPPDVYGTYNPSTGQAVAGAKPVPALGGAIDPALEAILLDAQINRDSVKAQCAGSQVVCLPDASYVVSYAFGEGTTMELEAWRSEHPNEYLLLVLDGKVIAGTDPAGAGMSSFEATAVAAILKSGPLPVTLEELSFQMGPSPSASPA